MTENTDNYALSAVEKEELTESLLKKQGCWVDWGKACYKLQQAGVHPDEIFETTGLQRSQQNLVIVASQVYESLVQQKADENTLTYYQGPRTDVLYELRVLNHEERLSGAVLAKEKQLDVDGAKEVAKAIKVFSRMSQPPTGFTIHPGDAVAYQYWKLAKPKKDLADKARLIAQGLKYVYSATARQKIEQLLTQMSATPIQYAPLLPIYRFESDEQLPCILPVVGSFPLSTESLQNIPVLSTVEPFGITTIPDNHSVVSIPTWQVVLQAEKPVVIICESTDLPKETNNKSEELLVVVDLTATQWDNNHYFLVEQDNQLKFDWFANEPEQKIVGQLLLILRPKKILDEGNLTEPWQMDD